VTHDPSAAAERDTTTGTSCPPRVIVVAVDGSPTSWDAFAWAAGAALRAKSRLVAVHVEPLVEAAATFGAAVDYAAIEMTRRQITRGLQSQVERAAKELGVQVTFLVEPGDVTRTVTSIAKELNADLVVVGRSAKPLHQIAGSLSHRLTCRHDAPVVVVVP